MRHLISGAAVAAVGLLAATPMSAGAQVVVDASVQVSDHLAVGVRYGHPYVVPVRVYPYRGPRRVVRRVVTLRELERAHWRWHVSHPGRHGHRHLAHGRFDPRLHAEWHRAMAHAQRDHGVRGKGRGRVR